MGSTITEKILARAGGVDKVKPGQNLPLHPDRMIAYDFPGYTDLMFKQMREDFGIEKVSNPERYLLVIDHLLSKGDKRENELHNNTREWANKNGVALIEGKGIGHQIMGEYGYALPGEFIVHFDGHVSAAGAFGALGWGVRRYLIEPWVTGQIYLDIPGSVRFDLSGEFIDCVDSRDLIHSIIKQFGADSCVNQVMELAGPGAKKMSIDQRQSLCAMAMFVGAVSAIFNPDEMILDYVNGVAQDRKFIPLYSDTDAEYSSIHQFDLNKLDPIVVLPGSSRAVNTVNVSDVIGTPIQRGYIGSCASGRLEDIKAAAKILKGKKVAPGFKLVVVPTSERIRQQAHRDGLFEPLIEAGVEIGQVYCDYCFGYTDPLDAGENCISTGVLNIPGRMGSTDSKIYLANAFTIAATAIRGKITDPREFIS